MFEKFDAAGDDLFSLISSGFGENLQTRNIHVFFLFVI